MLAAAFACVLVLAGYAVATGMAIFMALEAHDWRKRRRKENPSSAKSVVEMVRSVLPQEKAEYMLPMNDAEFEDHQESLTERGDLLAELHSPWTSPSPKSPSSDS